MQFLVLFVALDADVYAIAEADEGVLIFWLVVFVVESETDFQVAYRVDAVGVQMDGI